MSKIQICSRPQCLRVATHQLLGKCPICPEHADEKNRKARARSAVNRAAGRYSPAIISRMSPETRSRLHL